MSAGTWPDGEGAEGRPPLGGERPAVSLLHRDPPVTAAEFFYHRRAVFVVVLGSALVLAALAGFDDGALLAPIDEPVTRWLAEHRTPWADRLFSFGSFLGDNPVVFATAAVLAVWTWPRCRYLAVALVAAAAFRPAMEFVLKAVVDRTRPDIDPVLDFQGPSHPSGHPMAAASLWGLVPAVVAIHVHSRRLWWSAVAVSIGVVVLVAASRVYRGAHWLTDVVASLLWAALYLAAVQGFFDRFHHERDCLHPQHEVQAED